MAERGDSQPGDASGRRERQALGEHLADQPPAPGAKRGAHAELTRARRSRQQQVATFTHATKEDSATARTARKAPAAAPDHLLLQREEHHRPARVALRKLPFEIGVDAAHLAERLLERDALTQPRDPMGIPPPHHGPHLLHRQAERNQVLGF